MKNKYWITLILLAALVGCEKPIQPNVILIMTDDQGYGDLRITGNPNIITPTIDAFAERSLRFNNFHVSPVCAPTRSSLMTGRYSLRTGIRDTYNGGAIMSDSEVTIAEMLKQADYATGIFGKWHLGDNYPSRPSDQGFDESLIHLAGGMGQVGDFTNYFKKETSYFDPTLWHNNQPESYEGYCSDIFTDNAIDFIEKNREKPFFCYLSFNAPHTPLQVPDQYYQLYKELDPLSGFNSDELYGIEMSEEDKEAARKVYGMVTNIDDNLAKLFRKVEELGIKENTIIIFMTDNGPQQIRYVGGMKGRKSSVYKGGIRVPFYLQYPAKFKKPKDIEGMAAHIDLLPTLAELCNAPLPKDRKIDGKNLLPLIEKRWVEERSFYSYWTRKYPELYNNMALQRGDYKLVGKTDFDGLLSDFELYDIAKDPNERANIIDQNIEIAANLKLEMDETYSELINSKNFVSPPRITVGSKHENPIFLNRNDAGGERGVWNQEELFSYWSVNGNKGYYKINFKFIRPVPSGGRMFLETKGVINQKKIKGDSLETISFDNVYLPAGPYDFMPFYSIKNKKIFPFWVEIKKITNYTK